MRNHIFNLNRILTEQDSSPTSRRKFLGNLGKAGIAATAVGTLGVEPFLGGKDSVAEASSGNSDSPGRMNACFNYRKSTAQAERISVGVQPDNGDAARFTDFSGSYSKALL